MTADPQLRIGTAGWSIPRTLAASLEGDGTHLVRYARAMNCVEINSSFHRPHRISTYARWADGTPDDFRFSVKLPRTITHDARLHDVDDLLDRFLGEVGGLGDKLGVLLVQLPPSLAFDTAATDAFFARVRARYAGGTACEPRHASWFAPEADALLSRHRVARVAADPAVAEAAATPGGWLGLAYHRWHGSPRMYRSAYDEAWLTRASRMVVKPPADVAETWCIFDNTAAGAALDDALRLRAMLRSRR